MKKILWSKIYIVLTPIISTLSKMNFDNVNVWIEKFQNMENIFMDNKCTCSGKMVLAQRIQGYIITK